MKKVFLFFASFVLLHFCKAQSFDTTTYYGKMNYIFSNISHTQITTGLLRDYGIDFLNLDDYTGKVLNDSNYVTLTDWRSLYASIYSEQINTPTTMLYLDTINRLISQYALSNLPVTFTCLYYNYNVLDSNAAINNLMTIQNGQLYDVPGRSQSPYLLHSLFAIAPTQQTLPVGNNQMILRPQLFLSNTGKTINSLQIDPKGTGTYQTVSFNTPFTVSYDTAGLYTVNFKITYADGTINYSHTKLAAENNSNGGVAGIFNRKSDFEIKGYGPPFARDAFIFGTHYPYIATNFTADQSYLGIAAQGDYTVDLSVNNTTGQIKKPLIVVSGFDPDAVNNNDDIGLTYTGDYISRINYDYNNNPLTSIPLNSTNGLDDADSYDIVYLHWHNGTDFIERNAYLLEKLIQIVNGIKANNGSTEKNVIIGTSMGGLVARWALRDMEMNNIPHDTRLFISDDAPNWGANVPPAYQALVQYIAPWQVVNVGSSNQFPYFSISWSDMFPDAVDGLDIFNSPAAEQMLIQRYTLNGQSLSADNSTHTAFMNELNSMGWPVNCRNVVLSNGACNGSTIFNDNSEMLNISGNQSWSYFGSLWRSFVSTFGGLHPGLVSLIAPGVPVRDLSLIPQFPLSVISTKRKLDFDFEAWSVPSSGTSLIFKGDVSIRRQLLWTLNTTSYILKCHVNSTSDMLPLDNAPGSKYDINQFGINIDDVNAQLHQQMGNWINASLLQSSFCFVPTVSSLALNNPQQNLRVSLCSDIPCLLPSQISDYYAPQQNEIHISYTNDNSNWILQRQDANFSCVKFCPSNLIIAGDNNFCTTSNNYTISNLPAGVTVSWSVIPSSVATPNTPNSTQTTLSKSADGTATLQAIISNGCGGPVTISKSNIAVGVPVITGISSSMTGGCNGSYQDWMLAATANTSVSSWHWTVDNPSNNWIIYSPYSSSTVVGVTGGGGITVHATNACGTGTDGVTIYSNCYTYGAITASPNPATNNVTIAVAETNDAKANSLNTKKMLIYNINVVDQTGNLKKQFSYPAGISKTVINLNGLISGMYTIQAFDGSSWSSVKVIKE